MLIVGGTGVIGSKLVEYFKGKNQDVKFTYLKNRLPIDDGYYLDIIEKTPTVEFITNVKPDIIIHTTAITNVDLCETNKNLADSVNVNGVRNIIDGAKISKSKIIYISTSAVFDGRKEENEEEDRVSPISYYGITKAKGEEYVKKSGLPYLILRIDQPYCWIEKWQHTNSVLRVLDTLGSQRILNEVVDWYNTPTYVPDFVRVVFELCDKAEGIFHTVGSDFINRYEWALKTARIFGLNQELIKPISSDKLNLPARRSNVKLANRKLFQKIGIKMNGVDEGLNDMIRIKKD